MTELQRPVGDVPFDFSRFAHASDAGRPSPLPPPTSRPRRVAGGDLGAMRVDLLARVLDEAFPGDRELVGAMATSRAFARATVEAMRARHPTLEAKQLVALVHGLRGANLFLTGAGGCGKSHVANMMLAELRRVHPPRCVCACATTAIAASLVSDALTLDATIGCARVATREPLPLGRLPLAPADARALDVATAGVANRRIEFAPVLGQRSFERLRRARVLLIDEVSMLSAEKLEAALQAIAWCRSLGRRATFADALVAAADPHRRPADPAHLRGLQLIFVGDFAQLAPVTSADELRFAFESPAWRALGLRSVSLDVNRRTDHPLWSQLLERVRAGESICRGTTLFPYARALTQPLEDRSPRDDAVERGNVAIFATNARCAEYNRWVDERNRAPRVRFDAHDLPAHDGRLGSFDLPPELTLRAGARVVVTVNCHASDGTPLANGTMATVVGGGDGDRVLDETLDPIASDAASSARGVALRVDLPRGEHLCALAPHTETARHATSSGELGASHRRQLPLVRASAFTVHKAQGSTIRSELTVDTRDWSFSKHGMVYVALSRCADPKRLIVYGIESCEVSVDRRVRDFHREIAQMSLPFWALEANAACP